MTKTTPKSNPQDTNSNHPISDSQAPDNGIVSETSEQPTLTATPVSPEDSTTSTTKVPRITLPPSPKITALDPPKYLKRWRNWRPVQWWQSLNLRSKAIVTATLIGVIPVVMVGSITYSVVQRGLTQQFKEVETANTEQLSALVTRFMKDRYFDIQELATWEIFTNPQLRTTTPKAVQQASLDNFMKISQFYDNIAFFDLKGDVISQSQGTPLKNHRNRSYFQSALNSGRAVLSQPLISTTEGTFNVYMAAPVKDKFSGKIIGIIRARMPVKILQEILRTKSKLGEES